MDTVTDTLDSGLRIGLYFGVTSGVITTLGLLVGLHAGTGSLLAVVGGIVTIAIADALSDALGVHIAKESEPGVSERSVWLATVATFAAKFVVAISFVIPVVLLPLQTAIFVAVAWGLGILTLLSYFLAKNQGTNPWTVIAEHTTIAVAVVLISHFVGVFINRLLS